MFEERVESWAELLQQQVLHVRLTVSFLERLVLRHAHVASGELLCRDLVMSYVRAFRVLSGIDQAYYRAR